LEHLKNYQWPGNVRELANIVQQVMVFCKEKKITINDLPSHLFLNGANAKEEKGGKVQLMKMVQGLEKKWILSKLKETGFNQEKTAKLLGITRKMLINRITKYNLRTPKN
jgi:DNA-binding NtrC family response regulator